MPRSTTDIIDILGEDAKPTRVVVAEILTESDGIEVDEIRDEVPMSHAAIRDSIYDLEDRGLVESERRPTGTRGRDPKVYYSAGELIQASDDDELPSMEERKQMIVKQLAVEHYLKDISSVKLAKIGAAVGSKSSVLLSAMKDLVDEGAVEVVKDGSPKRYRLTGAGEYTPFRK